MCSEVRPPTTGQVRGAFGVGVGQLRPHPGGFEADAFTDGRWLVKLWRQRPDSDAALALTAELAVRGISVPAAQRALDGSYTAEHHGRRYALFPFVEGRQATWHDADAIARAMRGVHEIADLVLPRTDMHEWCIQQLRDRREHPWIGARRDEVLASVDRLEAVIERARAINVPHVVCHHDLFPHNVLVDRDGRVAALLDWGRTMLAPREHDVFAGLCGPDPVRFLRA
jgi:Ser/Thr protein kinase RdoA (MazF antagonist)